MFGLDDILESFTKKPENPTEELVDPIDYGNGVLFFPCIREQFAKSLSAWIAKHPQSVVCSVCPNQYSNGTHSLTMNGYVVVVRRVR